MATYFAIGGGFTWTSANTANWSASSGGATAGVAPTASDTVIFDSNSGGGTVTWTTGACMNLSCTGGTGNYTGIITGATAETIPGSLTLASSMTFSVTATLTFTSTSSGQTITTGGNSMPSMIFNGVGGVWTLQDTLTLNSTKLLTLTSGDLECNAQTINTSGSAGGVSFSGSSTRILTITNCTINLGGTGTIWNNGVNTNLTFTSTGSTINITDTSATAKTFTAGTNTYHNINITGGTNMGLVSLNNAFTIDSTGTLSNTPGNPVNININNAITLGNIHIIGSATTQSIFASNVAGTAHPITLTNASTVTYTTFQDSFVISTYITATTGGINNGNNRGIIFATGPYCLQVGTTATASSSATLVVTWSHTVTTGSLLVVGVTLASGTVTSVTDAKGNTYTQAATATNGTASSQLFYAYNVAGGTTDTVTLHLSTTGLVVSGVIREYGGMALTSPLDKTGTATGASGNISVTTASNTTQAVELVLAFGSDFTSTDTMTVGTGYTNLQTVVNELTAQSAAEEVYTTTTGSQTATFVNSVTSTWLGIIVTFKIASASGFLAFM